MQLLAYGKISELSQQFLPQSVLLRAPNGARRNAWLAGRALLYKMLKADPRVELSERYNEQGKPYFKDSSLPFFNISHSGDYIACFISTEGEVGCDIELIRPRENWQKIALEYFSPAEHQHLAALSKTQQINEFWHLWTQKEAFIKREGKSVWQIKTSAINAVSPEHKKSFFTKQFALSINHEHPISAELNCISWL